MRDKIGLQRDKSERQVLCWQTIALMILSGFCTASSAQTGQWIWVAGSARTIPQTIPTNVPAVGPLGVYGTLGTPASGNTPGARKNAVTWTDSSGNLWLFGGGEDVYGHDAPLLFNDIWRFSPSTRQWAWMGGSDKSGCKGCGQAGVYGTLGTAAPTNIPGSRDFATGWTDAEGKFWLYGGGGYDATRYASSLSDLWEFDPSSREWTWMGGTSTIKSVCNSGTLGVSGCADTPGFREFSVSWNDGKGDFWLFGGWGMVINGAASHSADLNDLWEYDPSKAEWVCIRQPSRTVIEGRDMGVRGVYAVFANPHEDSIPGAREDAMGWTDKNGNLWLFGGKGLDSLGTMGFLNDLWEFDPSIHEWAWIGGGDVLPCKTLEWCGIPGIYGILEKSSAKNAPGGRSSAASWTDSNGNLWLFGGTGADSSGGQGTLNDLWEFKPSTGEWTWMSGSATGAPHFDRGLAKFMVPKGIYGTAGHPSPANVPGGRSGASSWTDRDGNLWLFGGLGYDSNGDYGYLNDLWEYRFSSPALPNEGPVISPTEDTYTRPQYVTISAPTPEAVIYYTLDGTIPSSKSLRYTAGITIEKDTTVRAIAIESGQESDVSTVKYKILQPR